MKKHFSLFLLLFVTVFANTCRGQIIEDASGNKFITIGSTKDEVLEILGTPRTINTYLNWWYYDYEYLTFDRSDRVKEYSDAKILKILLQPSSKKTQPQSTTSNSTNNISNSSKTSTTNSSSSLTSATGYGEISEKTGRPKTVAVKGYIRKDGTYVKPHYRSAPKRK